MNEKKFTTEDTEDTEDAEFFHHRLTDCTNEMLD